DLRAKESAPKLPTNEVLVRNDNQSNPKPEVKELQKQVNQWRTENGKDPIKEDGYFGKDTETAVKEFQNANGLKDDGKAGVQTQNRVVMENNPNFKKLDNGIKDQTRKLMTEHGQDKTKVENLRNLATNPGVAGLSKAQQQQMLDIHKAHPGDKNLNTQLGTVANDPKFQALNDAGKTATLNVLGSPGYTKLSEKDRALVNDGLNAGKFDPKLAENTQKLLNDPKFEALKPQEKTAVLSQVKNYPNERAVGNYQRMLQKDWFSSQSLEDKQRSLKTVGYLSSHETGDKKVIDNTLNKLLDPASDFKLEWKSLTGNIHGEADHETKTLTLNKRFLAADNNKVVEDKKSQHMILSTAPHEVNHVLNKDEVGNSYKYFEAEYRAWYVGFQARHGRVPTNEEAMKQRISWQLNEKSFYGPYAKEAMKDPAEAAKFYDLLTKMSGKKVDASNWDTVIKEDPSTWAKPGDPAPVPGGNIDNH
ncbi:MAG TPA: peptidoglycan-binding domain-containing protein, partial [Acidobacteriota bacterium]|nr:peptidoglycan-binding domain-containing protein [Acidobacteriota bacterium]